MEVSKTRQIPENTWYMWHEQLISNIPKPMKKSESNAKQKVIEFFESKIDNNTSSTIKQAKNRDTFESRYVEYKSEKDKKLSIKECLKKY